MAVFWSELLLELRNSSGNKRKNERTRTTKVDLFPRMSEFVLNLFMQVAA